VSIASTVSITEFDFELPPAQIASSPARPRDSSKLLVCLSRGRLGGFSVPFEIRDNVFTEIENLLTKDDVLILNDAKVLPVRLLGNRLGDGTFLFDGPEQAVETHRAGI
jgi:S-adenosylmethionine:tRNA ribosyltransferase-isomerase